MSDHCFQFPVSFFADIRGFYVVYGGGFQVVGDEIELMFEEHSDAPASVAWIVIHVFGGQAVHGLVGAPFVFAKIVLNHLGEGGCGGGFCLVWEIHQRFSVSKGLPIC